MREGGSEGGREGEGVREREREGERERGRQKLILPPILYMHLPTVHQPLLKALDRTDILEAPERFKKKKKQTDPPPREVGPSAADYDGLSTLERKAKRAKKFGVNVGAIGVGDGAALNVALRGQKSPLKSRPPSEFEDSRPPPPSNPPPPSKLSPPSPNARPLSEFEDSRPPPPLNPPPPSKLPPPSLNTPVVSDNKVPPLALSPPSSPSYIKIRKTSSGASLSPRSKSGPPPPVAAKPPSPRRKQGASNSRPINVTVTTNANTTAYNASTTTVSTAVYREPPIPKPRTKRMSSDSSWSGSSSGGGQENRSRSSSSDSWRVRVASEAPLRPQRRKRPAVKSFPGEISSGSSFSTPNERNEPASSSESLHTQRASSSSNNTPIIVTMRRALTAQNGESTLDRPRPKKRTSTELSSRYKSSSVPDLLDDTTPHYPPPPTSPHLEPHAAVNGGLYPPPGNFVRSRGLASSSSDLFEGTPIDGRDSRGGSSLRSTSQYSDHSDSSGSTATWSHDPPQVSAALCRALLLMHRPVALP